MQESWLTPLRGRFRLGVPTACGLLLVWATAAPLPARGTSFVPGGVFAVTSARGDDPMTFADRVVYEVTAGGDLSGSSPLVELPGDSCCQIAWSADRSTMFVPITTGADRVVAITADGVISTFAMGFENPTGILVTSDGRILASGELPDTIGNNVVYDITAGGDFSAATPFATGLTGPANLLELSTGEILVAEVFGHRITEITAGGDFGNADPFASGLLFPLDLVEDTSGRILATYFAECPPPGPDCSDERRVVGDITGGGDFTGTTPFALDDARRFDFVAVAAGRILAGGSGSGDIVDITAGGDFSGAAAWVSGLPVGGLHALDTVPIPEPGVLPLSAMGLGLLARLHRARS